MSNAITNQDILERIKAMDGGKAWEDDTLSELAETANWMMESGLSREVVLMSLQATVKTIKAKTD